jgi:hypothetical protein
MVPLDEPDESPLRIVTVPPLAVPPYPADNVILPAVAAD